MIVWMMGFTFLYITVKECVSLFNAITIHHIIAMLHLNLIPAKPCVNLKSDSVTVTNLYAVLLIDKTVSVFLLSASVLLNNLTTVSCSNFAIVVFGYGS